MVNPSSAARKVFARAVQRESVQSIRARRESLGPAIYRDGRQIGVMANVSCREDVEMAMRNGADGVGLFRIENIYLTRKLPPTADELTREIEDALGRSIFKTNHHKAA